MKRFTAFLICILMILSLSTATFAASTGGVELPDLQVGGNQNNGNGNGGNNGDGIELPDLPANDKDKEDEELKPSLDSAADCTDVKDTDWFYDEVDYAIKNGIFDGTSATTFAPLKEITRAEFVQVLANLYGLDTTDKNVETTFTDAPAGKWYSPAVKWAKEKGIVDGVGDGKFAPDKAISRQEMCAMLINYVAFSDTSKEKIILLKKEDKLMFSDDTNISDWAKDKVYQCQMANLVNGMGDGTFEPKATANRAQAATIFSAFHLDYLAASK